MDVNMDPEHSQVQSPSQSPAIPPKEDLQVPTATLCSQCLSARTTPSWPERLRKARFYLHCARCKANHPRCLFSKAQRDPNIKKSIRYCIGHEGLLRLCEHKAVSWMQISAWSKSILKQKAGKKYRVIRCLHSDHENVTPTGAGTGTGTGIGGSSCSRRIGSKSGYPTLTVGFKDSSKEFSLVLSWEGHISLELGDTRTDAEIRNELKRQLAVLRETQGRYICPEPEPGLKVEDMVVRQLTSKLNFGDLIHDEAGRTEDENQVIPEKEAVEEVKTSRVRITELKMKRSSVSSISMVPRMILCHQSGDATPPDTNDTESLLTTPTPKRSTIFKTGNGRRISGSSSIVWGWGVETPPRNDHPHERHEISPKSIVTDTLRIKPCRKSTLGKIDILRKWLHSAESPGGVHLKVKYKRRLCVGDNIRGASVRDISGFLNWISVLDPDSYKLTDDFEGEGVYWCRSHANGNMENTEQKGRGESNSGLGKSGDGETEIADSGLDNHEAGGTVNMNLDMDINTGLDTDENRDSQTNEATCQNYYRHFSTRIKSLKLRMGEYTEPCPH